MRKFDLEAAKRGAEVCTRRGNSVRIITFYSKAIIDGTSQPIIVEFECDNGNVVVSSFSENGHYFTKEKSPYDLMMRDDDYLERLEWIEYGDHIADASKMGNSVVKQNLITETPTCKESLPVGLTKREWFAGMAMAGEIAGFLAGDRDVNGEEKGVPKVIAEDAVLFVDATIAELEKTKNLEL